ncbi:MAG: tetratricopeptide repeat protein [Candidatus Omnitrophica bacterium]|nr:tetratricopeptide repeat protein [Candidatus Omnitrophota bacterium]
MKAFKDRHAVLLIITLGLLTYANSWSNGFVWDDEYLIVKNSYIRDGGKISDIFTSGLTQLHPIDQSNYYRPLQILSFKYDYLLWRFNPFGYHLSNTFVHILVAILVYLLTNLLAKNRVTALFTSLFFLVHPVQTQAITFISGRADPMAGFFLLLSLFLFIEYNSSSCGLACYLGALLSFFLALLCREIALIFPFTLLAYGFYFRNNFTLSKQSGKYIRRPYLWFFLLALGYLVLRLSILKFTAGPILFSQDSFGVRLLTFLKAFPAYLGILFFPHNLHPERRILLSGSLFEPQVIFSFLLLLSLALLIVAIRKREPVICFGLAWFFIFLLPVSNIFFPLVNLSISDNWLYLPSIGVFLVVAVLLSKLYQEHFSVPFRKTLTFLVTLLIVLFSILTVQQNKVWKDNLTLYQWILQHNPSSAKVHSNLGDIYFHNGFMDQAVAEFKQAIKFDPYSVMAHYNLAGAYAQKEFFDLAIDEYQQTLRLVPQAAIVYNKLNQVYQQAVLYYQQAIDLDPTNGLAHYNLGVIYERKGLLKQAVSEYEQAIKLKSGFTQAHNNLGNIYENWGDFEQAIEEYKKAVKINPEFAQGYYNIGVIYANRGELAEAIIQWQKALAIHPDYEQASSSIGKANKLIK